jgi:hypothetical protein
MTKTPDFSFCVERKTCSRPDQPNWNLCDLVINLGKKFVLSADFQGMDSGEFREGGQDEVLGVPEKEACNAN